MQSFEYTIKEAAGLHARPAGLLVKTAKAYVSRVMIAANGKESDATRLMALMAMCIKTGTTVTVTVEGSDETECAAALQDLFQQNM